MPVFRAALIFICGAVCGAGLVYLFLFLPASKTRMPGTAPGHASNREASDHTLSRPGETRIVFAATEEERAYIRAQMLAFLVDLQDISSALASEDREEVGKIAAGQARPADPGSIGHQLRQTAPQGFMQISQSLRGDFADLAAASETETFDELQERVSLVMSRCVACHGSYAVSTLAKD